MLKDQHIATRTVYWYYEQVVKEGINAFTYPGLPKQVLRPHSTELYQVIEQKMEGRKRSVTKRTGSTFLKVLLVLLVVLLLFYIYGVPWIAGKMAERFPVSTEKKLGEQFYQSMKGSFSVDEGRTAYVNSFFKALKIPSEYDIQVTVVKSNVTNAFAMPGGHIVIYDHLLNQLGSYEELAALLSHEFTHIEQRHSLKSIFRQFSSKIFLSLIVGNYDVVGSVLLNNADQLKGLSYSRSLETESDERGARLLAERKIDCEGFTRLLQILKKQAAGPEPPELVASHPNIDSRIKNMRSLDVCSGFQPTQDTILHGLFLRIKTAE